MRSAAIILLYLAATLLLAAALAPLLFWGARAIEPFALSNGWLSYTPIGKEIQIAGPLAFLTVPFDKFFNRSVLIAALLLIWPAARALEVRNWAGLGLQPNRYRWQDLGGGFVVALASMVVLGGILLATGVYRIKGELPLGRLGGVLITAAVVALLEEGLFRGGIQGSLKRSLPAWAAIAFSAAIYSLVHFLKAPDTGVETAVHWYSGFALVPLLFSQFTNPALLLAGFSTLFMVGLVLGWATLRTRSLWLAIGLHAGWIVGTMGFAKLTKRKLRDTWPWVGDDLAVGLAPLAAVLVTWGVVAFLTRHVDRSKQDR